MGLCSWNLFLSLNVDETMEPPAVGRKTSIEWTDMSWNPVRGCSLVSAGCQNCYAMKTAHRFNKHGMAYDGLTEIGPQGPRWNGTIRLVPELLDEPLHWKKSQRVFVNSMSDLFHEDVPDEFLHEVFAVMAVTPQHTYQVLTKRPERMRSVLSDNDDKLFWALVEGNAQRMYSGLHPEADREAISMGLAVNGLLPNVWLGVSVEDQAAADERIPMLLQTPAAVRWISAEPLLGPVYVSHSTLLEGIDWIVVGGESGPGARPCDLSWVRSLKAQCQAAQVSVFVKQLGSHPCEVDMNSKIILSDKKGGDLDEWPNDLRVREWPQ